MCSLLNCLFVSLKFSTASPWRNQHEIAFWFRSYSDAIELVMDFDSAKGVRACIDCAYWIWPHHTFELFMFLLQLLL